MRQPSIPRFGPDGNANRKLALGRVGAFLVAVLSTLPGRPARAQEAAGVVTGRVISAVSAQPLEAVLVDVVGSAINSTTNPDGVFVLTGLAPGLHTLRFRRFGLMPSTHQVQLVAGHDLALPKPVELETASFRLDDLVITGYLNDFLKRRGTERGYFFTRADIDSINPFTASDIWKRAPQVRRKLAIFGLGGQALRRSRARRGAQTCRPVLLLNGFARIPFPGDELLPSRIRAVEVYNRWGTTPPQFRQFGHDCEVIVVWTL